MQRIARGGVWEIRVSKEADLEVVLYRLLVLMISIWLLFHFADSSSQSDTLLSNVQPREITQFPSLQT